MIGLTILVFLVIYIFISYKVIKFVMKKTQKKVYWVLIMSFFILLPTWDIIIGKIYFNHLCETQGGLKVYKKIKADGFLDTSEKAHFYKNKLWGFSQEKAKKMLNYGFKFYEVKADNEKIVHFFKDRNKNISYTLLNKPESEYRYEYIHFKIKSYILSIFFNTQLINDKQNNKMIQYITFYRIGWVAKLVDRYLGGVSSDSCFQTDSFTFKNDFEQKLLKGNFNE